MKNKKTITSLLVITLVLIFHQPAQAQIVVRKSVMGNGGVVVSDSAYRVFGTLGQALIGVVSNTSNINASGFWAPTSGLITSVEQKEDDVLPKEFSLEQNYPNPFNPTTTIEFALPKQVLVTLKIFDILGREVATLVDKEMEPGEYQVEFDASALASGVYFYQIRAQEFVRTKKLMLLK